MEQNKIKISLIQMKRDVQAPQTHSGKLGLEIRDSVNCES